MINSTAIYPDAIFKKTAWVVLLCAVSTCTYADVSGTVYQELPTNSSSLSTYGIQEANEKGVSGIDVIVTGDNGVTETVQTGADGSWATTLGAGAFGGDVRVEFSNVPGYLHPGPVNSGSNTTVQFIAEGGVANLGLHDPANYSSTTNPMMGTPRYISGDPLLGGGAGNYEGFVGFQHSFSGEGQAGGSGDDFISFATTAQIGSTWGTAYQRSSKTVFVAASYRRHVGLGPLNTSGIYSIDLSTGSPGAVTNWLDVNTLGGVDTGSDPRSGGTDLDAEGLTRNYDWRAYPAVGKIAMGDMDISTDDQTLYVVNLNDKTVIPIDVATKTLAGSVISIPDPGCSDGDYRPWGLEFHQGELYAGVVCSAETSQLQSDLVAHVMKLSGGTFSSVFSFSLDYDKGYNYHVSDAMGTDATWDPWTDDFYGVVVPNGIMPWGGTQLFSWTAQPILADIEFDADGSMILGFLDRHAYQSGYDSWAPDPTESREDIREWVMSAGDILRACPDGTGGWSLESNASCGGVGPTSGADTGQGPANGEFYHGDEFFKSDGENTHQEVILGGLAMLPGSGRVAAAAFDPINGIVNAGGIRWLDNDSGESTQAYLIYKENYPPEQGKAVGLGDVEIFADEAPLQVGNRVWDDVNNNGVQDPGEPPIEGVAVTLTCGALTATSTSDASGAWLIKDGDLTGGEDIPRNTTCTISVPVTEPGGKSLTARTADSTTGSDPDPETGSFEITTGYAGQNDHSFDIGYREPIVDLSLIKSSNKASAKRGDTVIYTLTLSNDGPDTATGVKVSDNLPDSVTHAADNPEQGSYDPGTGIWDVGSLAAGSDVVLTITVTVD